MLMDQSNMDSTTDRSVDDERLAILSITATSPRKIKLDSSANPGAIDDSLKSRLETEETILVGDSDHRTRLIERIGAGSFGEIYLGLTSKTNARVAVKVEPQNSVVQFLLKEGSVYRKLEGGEGIPRVHWYGLHGADYAMMVMDLLGSTLYDLWVACGSRFSLKTVLLLADQMLHALEHVHRHHYVHRDISVSNIMTGAGPATNRLFLIDFGHAHKMAATRGMLVPAAAKRRVSVARPMVGTPRFASAFQHVGQEPGYRDDLESLAYVWVYLLKGRLPWQGQVLGPGETKLDRIAHVKLNTRLESLCEGLPAEFLLYFNYLRSLRAADMPDHRQLRELFRELASALGIEYDGVFDWMGKEEDSNGSTNGSL